MKIDLKEILENAGYETRSYSGRSMYGKRCVGVVTERGGAVTEVIAKAFSQFVKGKLEMIQCTDVNADTLLDQLYVEIDFFEEVICEAVTDSMGKGLIIYWPNIDWEENEEENGESGEEDM